MNLSKYNRVVIVPATFDGIPKVPKRVLYNSDLVIKYHRGKFTTYKDRWNPRDKQIEIDKVTAAKYLLQDEDVLYLKWEERKFLNNKKENKEFEKKLNEVLQ